MQTITARYVAEILTTLLLYFYLFFSYLEEIQSESFLGIGRSPEYLDREKEKKKNYPHLALVHLDLFVRVRLPGQLLQLLARVLARLQMRLYDVLRNSV